MKNLTKLSVRICLCQNIFLWLRMDKECVKGLVTDDVINIREISLIEGGILTKLGAVTQKDLTARVGRHDVAHCHLIGITIKKRSFITRFCVICKEFCIKTADKEQKKKNICKKTNVFDTFTKWLYCVYNY